MDNLAGTPQNAQFFLITTAVCNDGTAASYLRPWGRDEVKALERLAATASTSKSETNSPAYRAFLSMKAEGRENSIAVLDGSPSIDQLDNQLQQAVFYAVERRFLDSYLQRLEGWWFGRVVKHLLDDNAGPIIGEELEAEASRIREQFKEDRPLTMTLCGRPLTQLVTWRRPS